MQVIGTIAYADVPGFPEGSVVDHVLVSIINSTGGVAQQSVAPSTASVTFDGVAAGDYTYSIQAFPVSGAGFGTPVTGSFTVAAPATITLALPASATFA